MQGGPGKASVEAAHANDVQRVQRAVLCARDCAEGLRARTGDECHAALAAAGGFKVLQKVLKGVVLKRVCLYLLELHFCVMHCAVCAASI